ncbi:hypothetical protein [Nocardiopsis synnemataformans]|uniref:hypothetical protein n=1 Tax=Nocardiopsis synnemataformans TaxID=61305 RepID=UPI003EBE38E1
MREMSTAAARDTLGEQVTRVATDGQPVRLMHYDRPDGALVSLAAATRLGYHLTGSHAVTEARRSWAAVRRAAAEQGPQALIVESQHIAVLLSEQHTRVMVEGHPELPETISWDGEHVTGPDGKKVEPGVYRLGGTIVSFGMEAVE